MELNSVLLGTTLIVTTIGVPGLAVTFALFPRVNEIRWSERLGLSLVCGLLPYLLLYFSAKNLSIPITQTTSQAAIAGVTLLGLAGWSIRRRAEPQPAQN